MLKFNKICNPEEDNEVWIKTEIFSWQNQQDFMRDDWMWGWNRAEIGELLPMAISSLHLILHSLSTMNGSHILQVTEKGQKKTIWWHKKIMWNS